ncbi:uncharacterized protein LOC135088815 [Scylla paramamosain]|uniref:uncharacterized protein LOC135088815 n=1 Tax=Scylla paramamosain TaxID=85552 RepID=UPI0030827EF8
MARKSKRAIHLKAAGALSAEKRKERKKAAEKGEQACEPPPGLPAAAMGESQPGPSLVKRKKVDTSNTTDEPQLKEDMPPALLKRKVREKETVPVKPQKEEYLIISKKKLLQLFENYEFVCPKCKNKSRQSTTVSSVRFGAVRRIHSQCEVCGEEEQQYTSNRVAPRGKFDANVKLVEFALSNNGFKTIEDMEETFENKFMSSASFHKIAKTVETEGITKSEERRRKKSKDMRKEESLRAREGTSYEAGGF